MANHVHTEQVLTSQAQQLKSAADIASQDTHLLHDTLERRKMVDQNIISVSDNFERSMQSNINNITSDIDSLNNEIDNQSKIFVEHIGMYFVGYSVFALILLTIMFYREWHG